MAVSSIALEAEEGKTPVALQRLHVLEEIDAVNSDGNSAFEFCEYLRHIWKIGHKWAQFFPELLDIGHC